MKTGQLLYHRINKHEAERRLQQLQAAGPLPPDSPATPVDLVSASPRATGGTPVTQQHLQLLRTRASEVMAELDGLGTNQAAAEFDRRISAVLWDTLDMVPAEAASMEVWWFLGLAVLPGTAASRFPLSITARHVGPPRRHVLRRLWFRRQALGDLLDASTNPLVEDELVGLTERTIFVSDPRLARAAAQSILEYEGVDRSHLYTRRFLREIQARTGTTVIGALDDTELAGLVSGADQRVRQHLERV